MPKINVYLPDELAAAVREAQLPVSSICQVALEAAVRDVASTRATDGAPLEESSRGSRLFTRFTPRARSAVDHAHSAARDAGAERVGTDHLLLGVLDQPDNLALVVLLSLDIEIEDLRTELVASMPRRPSAAKATGRVRFSKPAKRTLEVATKEALAFGHNYIGCEHLLLGLLATEEGTASEVMRRMGLEIRTTRRAVTSALAGFVHARRALAATAPAAATATTGSTSLAADELLAQIAARLDAIERRLAS